MDAVCLKKSSKKNQKIELKRNKSTKICYGMDCCMYVKYVYVDFVNSKYWQVPYKGS